MFNEFIGLEVCQAEQLLKSKRIDNFKFVYYIDRKQRSFDKKIVVRAYTKEIDGGNTNATLRKN